MIAHNTQVTDWSLAWIRFLYSARNEENQRVYLGDQFRSEV